MKSISTWIQAARPQTLIASISPVSIGSAMAMANGFFSLSLFCFLLLTALGIQITTNYANDWLDFIKGADGVERKGPLRITQRGLVTIREIKQMTVIVMIFTLLSALPLILQGGAIIAALVLIALLLALGYTGGPFPLAYLGLGDLFVLVFFGPVATCSTYFLYVHAFNWQIAIAGLAPGLLSCSLLTLNNLRDQQEDALSQKKTLVVRFGNRFGKWQVTFCLLLFPFASLFIWHSHPLVLFTLLCLLPSLFLIIEIHKTCDPFTYNKLLGKTGRLLALYTFIFCYSWML